MYIVNAVQLTCIAHASVESMIFSAWILSDDTPVVGRMNNIVTNWIFKPITCTQDKIQVSLLDFHCMHAWNLSICAHYMYMKYRILQSCWWGHSYIHLILWISTSQSVGLRHQTLKLNQKLQLDFLSKLATRLYYIIIL